MIFNRLFDRHPSASVQSANNILQLPSTNSTTTTATDTTTTTNRNGSTFDSKVSSGFKSNGPAVHLFTANPSSGFSAAASSSSISTHSSSSDDGMDSSSGSLNSSFSAVKCPPPHRSSTSSSASSAASNHQCRVGATSDRLSTVFEESSSPAACSGEVSEASRQMVASFGSHKKSLDDYQLLKVIGKGCMGKVLIGKEKTSGKIYAIKSISKKWVLSHGSREVEHIMAEQKILAALSTVKHPFLIRLHASFQSTNNLFLVMEYISGGDLATQLEIFGSFDIDRARFYCAEMVSGILELHRLGIIYRDLKPENVLLMPNGHIKLTDFGLSKQFKISTKLHSCSDTCRGNPDCNCFKTKTFCGTAEYLAPELLLQQPYGYEVDWWSLGTFLYEMLFSVTPFWADNHHEMYRRVLNDALQFPSEFQDRDAVDFIERMLVRNPAQRLGRGDRTGVEITNHPLFKSISWNDLLEMRVPAPYIPRVKGDLDVRWFDKTFTGMTPKISPSPFSPDGEVGVSDENMKEIFSGYTFLSTSAQNMMHAFGHSRTGSSGSDYSRPHSGQYKRRSRNTTDSNMSMSPLDHSTIMEEDSVLEFDFEDL